MSARALEAALVETGSSFDLSGKDLLSLQDAKVPGSVTDLIVALSYPDRFIVERRARADMTPRRQIDDPFFVGWAFGYPTWLDYGFYSPLYGPYSPYFYSPFYSYLPWYTPVYYGGGDFVVIGDGGGSGGGGGGGGLQPSGRGRVVDGLGYTRVRPREAEPTPHGFVGATGSRRPRADRHRHRAEGWWWKCLESRLLEWRIRRRRRRRTHSATEVRFPDA